MLPRRQARWDAAGGKASDLKPTLRAFVFGLLLSTACAAAARAELSDNDRLLYRQAYTAIEATNWDQAWNLAKQANDQGPVKLLHWVELMRGGPGARFENIVQFLDQNPDWPGQKTLRGRAEFALQNSSNETAAAYFKKYPAVSLAGKIREADLIGAAGKEADATARLRDIWINYEFTDYEEKNFLEKYSAKLRPEDNAKRLDRLLWDGRETEARRMLPQVDLDHRALGDARLALDDMSPNAEHLLNLVPAALKSDPGLMYQTMKWHRRKNQSDEAIKILDHPPADLGRPNAWANERQLLARIALSHNDVALAYRIASQHGLSEGPAFGELEFLAGWIQMRKLNDPVKAYPHFVRLYDQSKMPVSKARAAYWAAKAMAAQHLADYASGWYGKAAEQSTAYYGQLGGAAIGEASLARIQPEPEPKESEAADFETRELVRAARTLAVIGDPGDVKPFLFRLAEMASTPSDYAQVAKLAMALDRPEMAVYTARKASLAGVNLFDEYYPLVPIPPGGTAEAALVLAVTRQESAFDQEAISKAGARGMMQLMPQTAKKVAKELDLPYSRDQLTADRNYNMRLGHAYLDEMLTEFSGSYVLAIAAYNAGPARVHQWVASLGDPRSANTDAVDWVEAVPIAETRDYLQRVLENLQVYRLRLGNKDMAFRLAADLKR